jgi:hypothetical protein
LAWIPRKKKDKLLSSIPKDSPTGIAVDVVLVEAVVAIAAIVVANSWWMAVVPVSVTAIIGTTETHFGKMAWVPSY